MINKISIKEPIWKTESVGIADYKISKRGIEVKILYKDKVGNKVFPYIYCMSYEMAKSYPIQIVGRNVKLRIIPIADMQIKETKKTKPEPELITFRSFL